MKFPFSWGDQNQEAPTYAFNPEVSSIKSLERKRKLEGSPISARKQRIPSGYHLEQIIKEAVETAVQPLKEELAQIRRVLQEREQWKKQEEGSSREIQEAESSGRKEEKEKRPKKGMVQSYSQIVQKGLPKEKEKEDEWKTVVGKKKAKKRYPIEQQRLLLKIGDEQHQRQQPQDLLLLANQVLRKEQVEGVSFIQLNYSPTGQISAVLNEHTNRDMAKPYLKAIQLAFQKQKVPVISIGAVETWTKLKVHLVPIERYFQPGGLEIAREEIETTLGLQLPTAVRWLKKAETIQENREKGIQHTSIVVTVPNEDIARSLRARGLYFGGKKHPAEDFFDSSREVCSDCCQVGHKKNCTNPPKCFLCAGNHHWKDHYCKDCDSKKACKHIPLKCANCKGRHEAVNPSCLVARGKRGKEVQMADTHKHPSTPIPQSQSQPTPKPAKQKENREVYQTPAIISSDIDLSSLPPTPTPMEQDNIPLVTISSDMDLSSPLSIPTPMEQDNTPLLNNEDTTSKL